MDAPEQFTERAGRVLAIAQDEARGLGHNYVGTEHLLLGLLGEPDGAAVRALAALGVAAAEVREAIEYTIGRGEAAEADERALTPRARRVLELAAEEARRYDRPLVGTEHLLLGLMLEGEGVGAGILAGLGVTPAQVRDQLAPMLAAGPKDVRDAVETAVGRLRARKRKGDEADAPKGNVIACRVNDRDLAAIDALVEAGIRTTRSDAAAWLIGAGIEAHEALFAKLHATIGQIRQLRAEARTIMREADAGEGAAPRPDGATATG